MFKDLVASVFALAAAVGFEADGRTTLSALAGVACVMFASAALARLFRS